MSHQLVAAMIVKNEEAVLHRCFNSLVPHVERIIINDNGSTDGTPKIITELDMSIPVHGEWVDFAHNRNLVLGIARKYADYVLCHIDADEELVVPEGYEWPTLTADAYNIDVHLGNLVYPRVAIVRSDYPWEWCYPVQEGLYPTGTRPPVIENLPGVYIRSHRGEGARSRDPETQRKDLTLLQTAVGRDPRDPRMTFYLAQQYKDMGRLIDASSEYTRRLGLGGFEAERWYSMLMLGRIDDWMGDYPIDNYLRAFEMDPSRAEPLYYAADWCRRNERNAMAFVYAQAGALLPKPAGGLFVESDIYDWRLLDIMASVAWYTPFRALGKAASELLMARSVPTDHKDRIIANHKFYTHM